MTRTIVCFGNSNTYGMPPMEFAGDWRRHAPDVRWPGIAGRMLGPDWTLIEEGLPGRTTLHDDPIEGAHKNGLKDLPSILESHRPIDALVLMLGTNDLKMRFSVPPEDIAASVALIVQAIKASPAGPDGQAPKILLIAPARIIETGVLAGMLTGGAEKSARLPALLAKVASAEEVAFLDADALIAVSHVDGVHLDAAAHATLGRAVAETLSTLF